MAEPKFHRGDEVIVPTGRGKVLLKTDVAQILTEAGRICGVETSKGRRQTCTDRQYLLLQSQGQRAGRTRHVPAFGRDLVSPIHQSGRQGTQPVRQLVGVSIGLAEDPFEFGQGERAVDTRTSAHAGAYPGRARTASRQVQLVRVVDMLTRFTLPGE